MSKLRSGLANDRRRYRCFQSIRVVSGKGSLYSGILNQVIIPGALYESGNSVLANILDDGDVPIPMENIVFIFLV